MKNRNFFFKNLFTATSSVSQNQLAYGEFHNSLEERKICSGMRIPQCIPLDCFDAFSLKWPSQLHLCLCLHARVLPLRFIWSMSKQRKSSSNY